MLRKPPVLCPFVPHRLQPVRTRRMSSHERSWRHHNPARLRVHVVPLFGVPAAIDTPFSARDWPPWRAEEPLFELVVGNFSAGGGLKKST